MKANKYLIIALVTLSVTFVSCLEGEPPFQDNGNYGIVELNLSGNRTISMPYAHRSVNYKDGKIKVAVNYTGVNGTPADTEVTVDLNMAIVPLYATAMKLSYVLPLPADSYSVPASNVLSIPKGLKADTLVIPIDTLKFDWNYTRNRRYAIGVKISKTTQGIISGNFGEGIYYLDLPNKK